MSPSDPLGTAVPSTAASDTTIMAGTIKNWSVDQSISVDGVFSSSSSRGAHESTKVATSDFATFVPITPCRLVDTRGVLSPVYNGGPYATNEIRNYPTVGFCGIPATARPVAVSIQVFGINPAAIGNFEVVRTGTALGASTTLVDVPGTLTSVGTVVGTSVTGGSFTAQLRLTSGDIAIDINGYYANTLPDNQFLTVSGNQPGGGVAFFVSSAAAGAAVHASNTNTGARTYLGFGKYAEQWDSGELKSTGAGINTTGSPAFTLKATAANTATNGSFTYIWLNHPTLNGNGNALAIVTPVFNPTNVSGVADLTNYQLVFLAGGIGGIPANSWCLYKNGGVLIPAGTSWHVLAISP